MAESRSIAIRLRACDSISISSISRSTAAFQYSEVPTHPVAQARTQRLRERGLNPFENYSVPRAALRLKQGFGRLIRSASDRGAVVIYDRRLLTRRYGQVLLSSLPPAPVRVETLRDLPASVRSIVRPAD